MRAAGTHTTHKRTATSVAKQLKTRSKKKCSKCGQVRPIEDFGSNTSSADGRQTYCKDCKKGLSIRRREVNVPMRLKHHMSTRIAQQLGHFAPNQLTTRLEEFLGYKIVTLVLELSKELEAREGKNLRDALVEGYHVDHIHPLHDFEVIKDGMIDWEEFRRCWEISNLRAISAHQNLQKGGKIA